MLSRRSYLALTAILVVTSCGQSGNQEAASNPLPAPTASQPETPEALMARKRLERATELAVEAERLEGIGKFDEALEQWKQAAALDDRFKGSFDRATSELPVRTAKWQAAILAAEAERLESEGDFEAAIQQWKRASMLDDNYTSTLEKAQKELPERQRKWKETVETKQAIAVFEQIEEAGFYEVAKWGWEQLKAEGVSDRDTADLDGKIAERRPRALSWGLDDRVPMERWYAGNVLGDRDQAVPIPKLPSVSAVSAGQVVSAALTTTGDVWAWGGDGYADPPWFPFVAETERVPALVQLPEKATAISSGSGRTVAVLVDGSVWTWGRTFLEWTGKQTKYRFDNAPRDAKFPTKCRNAVTDGTWILAVGEDGSAYCCNCTESRFAISKVSGLSGVVGLALGNFGYSAVLENGTVWHAGRLGDEAFEEPKRVAGLEGVSQISSGMMFSLALTRSGKLYYWGRWDLSEPVSAHVKTPTLVKFSAVPVQIACSSNLALVLDAEGKVWGMGMNPTMSLDKAKINVIESEAILLPQLGQTRVSSISLGSGRCLAVEKK